jgi:hypothetical protein
VIKPTLMLDLRYGLALQRNQTVPYGVGKSATDVGFSQAFASEQLVNAIPSLNIGGYRGIGNDALRNWVRYTHAVSANLSWVRGTQTIKFGWDGRMFRDKRTDAGWRNVLVRRQLHQGPECPWGGSRRPGIVLRLCCVPAGCADRRRHQL